MKSPSSDHKNLSMLWKLQIRITVGAVHALKEPSVNTNEILLYIRSHAFKIWIYIILHINMQFLILAWFLLYIFSAKFMKWVQQIFCQRSVSIVQGLSILYVPSNPMAPLWPVLSRGLLRCLISQPCASLWICSSGWTMQKLGNTFTEHPF